MSLSLVFSSDISSSLLEKLASNEVTFHPSSSVRIMPAGVAVVDVTKSIYDDYYGGEFHFKGRTSLPNEPSPREVIVKVLFGRLQAVYSEKLQNYIKEATLYHEHLCSNSLCGNGVPKTLGFYEAKLNRKLDKRVIPVDGACMVYEFYGSHKDLRWSTGTGISDFR